MEISHPQIFQAQWPEGHEPLFPPYTDVVASIALVIFTAYYSTGLGIVCGIAVAAFWAVRKVATWIIHPISIPACVRDFFGDSSLDDERNQLKRTYQSIEIRTPDGFKLDGILHKSDSGKAVIYCGGNAEPYEGSANDLIPLLIQNVGDTAALFFNPRGVLESEGTSSPEMLQYDAYTAFEYLVSIGYEPSNICIVGNSLGGAYGVLGASLAQAKYPGAEIAAISIHSFASLPLEVKHLLKDGPVGQHETLGKIASVIVRTFGWEMDVATAWNSLKSPKKTLLCHAQDGIIPLKASLYHSTQDSPGQKIYHGNPNQQRQMWHHMYNPAHIITPLKTILDLAPSQCSDDTLP